MKKIRSIAIKTLIVAAILLAPISTQAATKTFEPTRDTYIDEALPTSSFGAIGLGTVSYQPSGELLRIMLLHFDVSSIPAGSTITSATLKLRLGGCIGGGSTGGISLGAYTAGGAPTWTESTTYNGITGVGSYDVLGDTTVSCTPGGYFTMNAAEVLPYWVNNTIPNDGFVLVPVQTGSTYWTRVFYMSEAASGSRPTLTVNYEVPYEEVSSPDGAPATTTGTTANATTATAAPQPLAADTTLAAPQQLVATQKEDPLRVSLSWKKSVTETTQGYAIYRKKGTGSYQKIASNNADQLTYTDKDVQRGQSYSYLVRSVRDGKESESSPVATIKLQNKTQKQASAAGMASGTNQRLLIAWSLLALLIIAAGSYAYYRLHHKHKRLVHASTKPTKKSAKKPEK